MSVFKNIYLEQIDNLRKQEHREFLGASQTIYNNFYTTVVSTFKWKNLPDTTLPFLPERHLYFYGHLISKELYTTSEKRLIMKSLESGAIR